VLVVVVSVVKVRFSPVHKVFYLNPELDFGFSSTPLPELWTGPSVLVQRGFSSGSEGDEPRTRLPKLLGQHRRVSQNGHRVGSTRIQGWVR